MDYEVKTRYTIIVSVHDGKDAEGSFSEAIDDVITVTIILYNEDDLGRVTFSSAQTRVGVALTATLTDPDGSISNLTWQWTGSPDGSSNWATISGAASATYTPMEGDVGNYLRAMASYADGHGSGKSAEAASANQVDNAPPPPITGGGGSGGGSGGGPVETDNECADELGALADAAIRNGTWASDCESSVSGRGNARYYSFSLSVETAVTIDLTSSVDTYLYLRQGDATSGAALHENDNHQGSTSASRIQETLAAGTYTVEATTNSAGATGPFTLTITVEYLPTARVSRADGSEDTQAWPGTPVSLTVTFSRPVSGFTIDDINVENAAVSNFAGSGAVYTFDVTPNDIGEVAVDISAGAAKDAYGNGNEAAPRFYLGIPYDDDGDGTVSRVEAIAAIRDYFDGKITRAQAIAVIRLYFA